MTAPSHSNDYEDIASFLQIIAGDSCKKKLTGIAIGVIFDGRQFTAVSGWADVESKKPISDSTVFEIGSLSKLFTSLLLAVAATKQQVNLDDPVQPALGEQVRLPTDGDSQITYRSLANHRSSLPRLPDDLIATANMENPYAHYNQEMFYACLNRMGPLRPIGSRASYSNFGVGLLGHALGKLAGTDYRTALKERVLIPLGMLGTSAESSDEQKSELALAHKRKDKPTKHWDFTEVTVAAGGLRSSLSEMLKFLRANLYPAESELAEELAMMRRPSNLPEPKGHRGRYALGFAPITYLVVLAIIMICLSGRQGLTQATPGGFPAFLIMLLPTMAAACWWGRKSGAVTLIAMTLLTWWLWEDNLAAQDHRPARFLIAALDTVTIFFWGAMLVYLFSGWFGPGTAELLRGDGRLAWQSSKIGDHLLLWHNGRVGGSASYLGIVQGHEIGVVVLTNTAKSVDAIGVKILSKLVKLKESGLLEIVKASGELADSLNRRARNN